MTDRAAVLPLLLAWALGGCDAARPPAPPVPANAAGGLETLAVESGIVDADADRDLSGAYGRTDESGRDRLCLVAAGHADRYRFGAEIRIGEEEQQCQGAGTARRAGETLALDFTGTGCTIVARYDGGRIVLPGVVDNACRALCSGRSSLAGSSFPRLADGATAARGTLSHDGERLCP